MAFYVSTVLLSHVTVVPLFLDRFDVAALDIYGSDLSGSSFTQFRILNVYTLRPCHTGSMTVSANVSVPELDFPLFVVGDYNIHHFLSDALQVQSSEKLAWYFPYFSRPCQLAFKLLNIPRVFNRCLLGGSSHPSVIKLSFASPHLGPAQLAHPGRTTVSRI